MPKISKEILLKHVKEGFFDEWKTLKDVIKRLSQKGYTIKKGKKMGLVAQLLAFLCQEDILERDELPRNEWGNGGGKWKYKKG